ncbi:MAG: TonB-dependent receptor, partial [Gemmobacter sp.]|nr:TonB-dependent receptor [Gemmobacter sp.]
MFRTQLPLLALTAILLPAAAMAQEDRVTLDLLVLSGGLSPVAADGYARAHTVLTAEDIATRGLTTVQDALRAVPGVSVNSTGTAYTRAFIRGADASHTLVLIDGVEAIGGADEYFFTGLETANIERIEILRGPQSVYYGSNASAGVINIVTRKATEPGLHYGGSVEVGNGAAASAWLTRRGERGGLSLNLSGRNDNGFDQSFQNGEKDGIKRRTAGLSGDWQATEDLSFGFTARRSKERFDYDSSNWAPTSPGDYVVDDPAPFSRRDETTGGLWAEYAMLGGRMTHRIDFQDSVFKQSFDGGPTGRGQTRKLNYRLSYGLDGRPVAQAKHLLNLLAEKQEDKSTSVPGKAREMASVALEYRGFLDNGLDIQAGLRHDNNKVFEDFTSWNLGLSWRIPDTGLRLHGSAGTGLVNPSFFELFADDDFGAWGKYLGNPDLKPERNGGYDLGIETEILGGRGLVDVTYFNESIKDAITQYLVSTDAVGPTYSFRNAEGKSPREGVEISGRLQATDTLSLGLSYTWLNARDDTGAVLIRRPRSELGLSATLAFL